MPSWDDDFQAALADLAPDLAPSAPAWRGRFPASFRDAVSPGSAAGDVVELAALADLPSPALRLRTSGPVDAQGLVTLSVYVRGADLELSRFLPILESLGLWVADELHWDLGEAGNVYDLRVRPTDGRTDALLEDGGRMADAAVAAWGGRAEVDDLNRLVTAGGLDWPAVDVLRAYARYRRQVDPRYTVGEVFDVLVAHPDVAAGLVGLFAARFDPDCADPARAHDVRTELEAACDAVARLDEDRILRGLLGTVEATVRTNRWSPSADPDPDRPLALKFDSAQVPDAPAPVPYREIWVHGRHVQGIHLRAGPVARGGLRWSDRPQDLRTEVLDLMRTQVLKNALIVPTGAKGGFVLQGPEATASGPERAAAARHAYEQFVGALLDLTDDRRGDEVVPVPGRRDGDDPYLVVAADRGTASFSDLANGLAEARGFWLGDAFAAGGSKGYDHKALGVTARGAWTAVTHHFAELGVDVQAEPISVVGIGDMSGDVFGNGLLRSPHVRLVAAFDHRDVFCDPQPDGPTSFEARRRLFERPGSSWQDYPRDALGPGGEVFSRSAKQVEPSAELCAVLRIAAGPMTPAELIRAILQAPVDLLYAGGIGTFVRASTEDDRAIDDVANSEVRVEASSLRARVVGEGANLAFTQRARIEYARRGGRINTDAIDNSAGVDTSDHEVNLKILLDLAVHEGRIDRTERDRLLAEQTEAVVAAVLADTAHQCERLTIAQASSSIRPGWFERVLTELVADRVLDPVVEELPDAAELEARRAVGAGLTRPELAVVQAGAKRALVGQLLDSGLPDQAAARASLEAYFPPDLVARFGDLLDRHPLRRELIATRITNDLVDRLGMTFVPRIAHDTGAPAAEVVAAAGVARGVIGADELWARLGRTPAGALADPSGLDPRTLVTDLLDSLTRWELTRDRPEGTDIDVAARVAEDRPVFLALHAALAGLGTTVQRAHRARVAEQLVDAGLAPDEAAWGALLPELRITGDVAELARDLGRDPVEVVRARFALDRLLGVDDLARRVSALELDGRWRQAAQAGLLEDLARFARAGLRTALGGPGDPEDAVAAAVAERREAVADARRFQREVDADPEAGLDGLAVAVRAVGRALAPDRADPSGGGRRAP